MGVVFEDVCRQLGLTDKTNAATRLVADKIIELAASGHYDQERLRNAALEAFRVER